MQNTSKQERMGTMPILAYNYGAKKMERVEATIKLGVSVILGLMLCLTAVFFYIASRLFSTLDVVWAALPASELCVCFVMICLYNKMRVKLR